MSDIKLFRTKGATVHVPRYDAGGMSSGHVSPEFWREVAIPLLCERFEKVAGKEPPFPDPKKRIN